ncbi:hypothetical protein FA95DRAFT_1610875 [Auriscalpium vulgare]|uniref:Uncharacterized protein n=1 Tax=Auriscalpium vulgare TaxID=40419 RepID=A0ACB8RC19_9AGAM|nr:hypothetical protein FA95DRAFT_1610875 [Auriscalpium vulgare]
MPQMSFTPMLTGFSQTKSKPTADPATATPKSNPLLAIFRSNRGQAGDSQTTLVAKNPGKGDSNTKPS